MPDPTCELCGDATLPRLVRSDPAGRWETLCPTCWMLNVPGEATAPAPPLQDTRLWQAIQRRARELWEAQVQSGPPVFTLAQMAVFDAEIAHMERVRRIAPPSDGLTCAERSALMDAITLRSTSPFVAQAPCQPEDPAAIRQRHGATRLYGTHCVCAVCREETS